jgi:hypothetical protein
MYKTLYFLLQGLLSCTLCWSQVKCGFDDVQLSRLKRDPAFSQMMLEREARLRAIMSGQSSATGDRDKLFRIDTIPVVVHVVHKGGAIGSFDNPSDASIRAALDFANVVYSGAYQFNGVGDSVNGVGDIGVRFVLAARDPYCLATSGIDRIDGSVVAGYTDYGINLGTGKGVSPEQLMDLSKWNPQKYFNIWLVTQINDGADLGVYSGYAYFPGDTADEGAFVQTAAMNAGELTLSHELGHALNIYHPFQGTTGQACALNEDCLADGDFVCDTDPVTVPANFACRTGTNPCTGKPFSINTEWNIMNYSFCPTIFTAGQKDRMRAALQLPSLVSLTQSRSQYPPSSGSGCSVVLSMVGQEPYIVLNNPTSGDIDLKFGLLSDPSDPYQPLQQAQGNVRVWDVSGKLLETWSGLLYPYYRLHLPLSAGTGVYILQVQFARQQFVKKIVKL